MSTFSPSYLRAALAALLALALAGCGAAAAAGNSAAAPWRGPTAAPAAQPTASPSPLALAGPADVSLGAVDSPDAGAELGVDPDVTRSRGDADQPAGSVTLRLGETRDLGGLRVRFVAVVEDSRCPDGATCVWAGRAVVAVEVEDGAGAPVELALGLPGFDPEAPAAQTVAGRQIAFVELLPYPALGAQPAADAALLTLQIQP